MKKRIILLIILSLGIAGLFFSSPSLQGSAMLGDDFQEDFESIPTGWSTTGLWHLEDNYTSNYPIWSWIPSGQHYMWYGQNTTGNYETGTNNSGTLTSDIIDLTSFEGKVNVGFWSWATTELYPDVDNKWVEISPDNGLSWNFLGNVEDSFDWEYYSFEITESSYYSSSVRIRFCFDTVDEYDNDNPGWMIDDITITGQPGNFALYIHQGRYAEVGETRGIDFEISSNFNRQQAVNVTIEITKPSGTNETLYPTQTEYIDGFGKWYHSEEYTFTEGGQYRVILIVEHVSGYYWTDCLWEIGPYFDLWIDQKNYALQYEYGKMNYYIDSHYDYGMDIEIIINITTPSGFNDTIYLPPYIVSIPAHGTYEDGFDYYFDQEGSYQVYMLVISEDGKRWRTDCWWEIGPYFDIQIEQENDAMVGEEKWMTFRVESFVYYDMNVNIKIIMELQSGKNVQLHDEDYFFISGDIWVNKSSFQFMETGHHHAKVVVTNTTGTNWWENWCCWNVREAPNKFELWIEQENYADVDEEGLMYFNIESFFDHRMDIDIKITIVTPDGTEVLLHEETTYIAAFGHWEYSHSYTFLEEGHYDVSFIVVDDIGEEWFADCRWEVGDDEPSDENDSDQTDVITPGFEGIFILGALAIATILIRRHRK